MYWYVFSIIIIVFTLVGSDETSLPITRVVNQHVPNACAREDRRPRVDRGQVDPRRREFTSVGINCPVIYVCAGPRMYGIKTASGPKPVNSPPYYNISSTSL